MVNWTETPRDLPAMTQTSQPAAGNVEGIQSPHLLVAAARELLGRTAELPGSKRGLLAVLSEYRTALFALAAEADKP